MTGLEMVPALRSRRQLDALAALGHPSTAIFAAMGRTDLTSARTLIHVWRQPGRARISAAVADQIDQAWHLLRDRRGGNSRTRIWAWRAGARPPDWWAGQDMGDPTATARDPKEVAA